MDERCGLGEECSVGRRRSEEKDIFNKEYLRGILVIS